jgi:folate-binding protein YgfZ
MVAVVVERGVVRATGADVVSYLQGQVSQDVEALESGSSTWSLVLQPSGKLTAWFRIHRVGDDEFLLDLEPELVDDLLARLERFKLRTAAEFVSEPDWQMLSIRGDVPPDLEGIVARFDWPAFSGVDVLALDVVVPDDITIDPAAFDEARIRATVPRMGVDLDDGTIPGEGGAHFIDMNVSFTKGCYTGQELVARIDSRGGNVPRPLRTLVGEESLTEGAPVLFEGTDVGVVSSAEATVGLARMLRKVEPGSTVEVDGITATVQHQPS